MLKASVPGALGALLLSNDTLAASFWEHSFVRPLEPGTRGSFHHRKTIPRLCHYTEPSSSSKDRLPSLKTC